MEPVDNDEVKAAKKLPRTVSLKLSNDQSIEIKLGQYTPPQKKKDDATPTPRPTTYAFIHFSQENHPVNLAMKEKAFKVPNYNYDQLPEKIEDLIKKVVKKEEAEEVGKKE